MCEKLQLLGNSPDPLPEVCPWTTQGTSDLWLLQLHLAAMSAFASIYGYILVTTSTVRQTRGGLGTRGTD